MAIKIVEEHFMHFDEKLLSLAMTSHSILTGGTNKALYDVDPVLWKKRILCRHNKSIRSIAAKEDLIICGSYDGNATVIYRNSILDVIEGPETEIKCVDILNCSTKGNYIALGTRGKTVWVCELNDKIKIDCILEDHTQDVKGVKFIGDMLYTYGYDNSVKVYKQFSMYDDSWVLLQSLEMQKETVWDIEVITDLFVACNDGTIYIYKMTNEWMFHTCIDISAYPIYTICRIESFLAVGVDSTSILILDEQLNEQICLKKVHTKDINCIKYLKENNKIATCSDDGFLKVFQVFL